LQPLALPARLYTKLLLTAATKPQHCHVLPSIYVDTTDPEYLITPTKRCKRALVCLVSPILQAASTLTEQQIKEVGGSSEGLTWFQWSDLGPDKRPSLAVKYSNWDVTYASLCDALRQQQPDGLFGFSQGATAAALFLAALQTAQRQGKDLDVPLPKFCVVVRGGLNTPAIAAARHQASC
jgi:hypothetical protein